jgi:cysteinyl-tRNA synthetase, unknown class
MKLVLVDAQYLSAAEIASMQERGQKVFTYLNIGSLETFRSYYE